MKILGICGSPYEKNTHYMIKTVLDSAGEESELVMLSRYDIKPCDGCIACRAIGKCSFEDGMNEISEKMLDSSALVLGSPTYFSNVSGRMKNFMDRSFPFFWSKELEGRKAALVAVGNLRYGEFMRQEKPSWDGEHDSVRICAKAMENFCDYLGLELVGSVYAIGGNPESKEQELLELGKKLVL